MWSSLSLPKRALIYLRGDGICELCGGEGVNVGDREREREREREKLDLISISSYLSPIYPPIGLYLLIFHLAVSHVS